ncbi:hypothetical protein PI124_g22807 [Phytophthora idaei]|nr:hypothetical protein PI125_g24721 [Phytophthora idaei]KAG3125443.1 hypothetical protein PI126_g22761 [Phytophthora idaei]KAG3232102.1 hypothetical protein PI124_g22807 [Phytophthora idaei]
MIRLYMSLREVPNAVTTPAQCIVTPSKRATRSHDNKPPNLDVSLCVRGMFGPPEEDITKTIGRWPFLSVELIKQLRVIANSAWWDGRMLAEYDLDSRNNARLSRVLPKQNALKVASKTLDIFSSK